MRKHSGAISPPGTGIIQINNMVKELTDNIAFFLNETDRLSNAGVDCGLTDGGTGIAIIYYLLAKHYNEPSFAQRGLDLLEWICESGATHENINFASGLAGIGWGIEWLVQNELMDDTNTDEVLAPIDDVLYKLVSYDRDDNATLFNGTLGKIAYFLKRAMARNPGTSRYKTIGHLECLVLLVDDLAEKMHIREDTEYKGGNGDEPNEWNPGTGLVNLGEILIAISGIKVNANSPTIGKVLFKSFNFTHRILSDSCTGKDSREISLQPNFLDLLLLSVCYLIASKIKGNKMWESQAVHHIQHLTDCIISNYMITPSHLFQKLAIFTLLQIHLPSTRYRKEVESIIRLLRTMEFPTTLSNGWGAIVIAELAINNPGLIDNWHEVLMLCMKRQEPGYSLQIHQNQSQIE